MMNFGVFIPIAAILATAWVLVTWLKPRRGGEVPNAAMARENALLAQENEALKNTIRRMEDRLGVLERIATDPAERTAREIEQLR